MSGTGKKIYTKTFVDQAGRRHYARSSTLEGAIIKREQMKVSMKSQEKNSSTLFKVWAEVAISTYKPNVSHKYLNCMYSRLNNHILPVIGELPIGYIKPLQCQQVLNSLSGMSRSHITKVAQELRFYFDTARKNGMIDRNPADDVVRPKGYTNKRRTLTPAEREAFLAVCEKYPTKFRVYQLMLYAGCRPEEAWNVRYEDVKEIDGVKYLHIRGTKTANSDRLVPVCEELYPLIVKSRLRGFCALTEARTKFNATSYKRLSERLRREMNICLGARLERNKIVEPILTDFVPYFFRHTFCTDLKKKGVDIRLAKNLMGHADIKTTANIYDHDDDETLRLAAEQMGVVKS